MEKWDIKVIDLGIVAGAQTHEEILRSLGQAGWELVAVSNFGPSARAYLKRPIDK